MLEVIEDAPLRVGVFTAIRQRHRADAVLGAVGLVLERDVLPWLPTATSWAVASRNAVVARRHGRRQERHQSLRPFSARRVGQWALCPRQPRRIRAGKYHRHPAWAIPPGSARNLVALLADRAVNRVARLLGLRRRPRHRKSEPGKRPQTEGSGHRHAGRSALHQQGPSRSSTIANADPTTSIQARFKRCAGQAAWDYIQAVVQAALRGEVEVVNTARRSTRSRFRLPAFPISAIPRCWLV